MSLLDDAIGVISPGWKAARLRSRAMIQAYEAVKPTRTHKARRENRSADQLSKMGAVSLREQARWLDNNHDLVIGIFDKLEERVVGKSGIIVEPHPKLKNGKIAKKLAADIRQKWGEWSIRPEVTHQFTRPMLERLMLRDPNIVLLDEPTASLDEHTERDFLDRLSHWLAGRTLIIATHRSAVLSVVDRVLVLKDGALVMDMPKEKAMARRNAEAAEVNDERRPA